MGRNTPNGAFSEDTPTDGHRLGSASLAKALEFVGYIYQTVDLHALPPRLLTGLRRLIPCDVATFSEVNTPTWSARWLADPADKMPPDAAELMKRYVLEHPLVQYHWDNSGARPPKLSDFMDQRELHRTALYNEFYGPLGINYQMTISLRVGSSFALGLSLSRTKQDFTERERDLLDVVQPHIMQAYRNAEMVSLLSKNGTAEGSKPTASEDLSRREQQVLLLLAEDRSNSDIAQSLYVSPRTVQKHLEHIYSKLGVHSRSGAVARALEARKSA